MRLVLDNVEQGFITLDSDGTISEERSRSVDGWFGDAGGGPKFWDYLGRTNVSVAMWFELAWESLQDGIMPLEVYLDQLPKSVTKGPATFELSYRPILDGERLDKLIVVITEVTTRLARERAEQAQREQMNIFRRVLADRFAFEQFFTEATTLVGAIAAYQPGGDIDELKRDVHTLKGNCALFEIESVASFCHDLENWMSESGQTISETRQEKLCSLWGVISAQRAELTRDVTHKIELEREEYEAFLASLQRGADRSLLIETFASWEFEPASRRFELVAEQIRRIAARLGRAPVEVVCLPTKLRLPPNKWNAFWSVFAHVVRNTVDHGIETVEERTANGKPPGARVTLGLTSDAERLVVSIEDDGRGIDWSKIAARAKAQGLPHETRQDWEQALFADGVSSREEATTLSGRGVGLSAVREMVTELGGSVEVQSEPGRGTTFRFVLPRSMLTEAPAYAPAA
jgi:two-component system chemotaxis sensor kinase CheA